MKSYESIIINRDSDEAMYIQVYEEIKRLIENGSIKAQEKLPPIRKLCESLGVNSVTIVNAYKLLEQRGFVYSKVGSGTYVRDKEESIVDKGEYSGSLNIHHGYIKLGEDEINFSTSTPNPELFPVEDFKEVLNEVLDRDGGFAFGYQESLGYFPLRESIRDYLEEKDVSVNTNNIHVISGAQQGIDIVAKALIGFNDTIIVESPTYTGAIAAFRSRGANIIEVPILNDGIDTKELEEILKVTNTKLIYVMTSFQNPTGVSYSQDKKLQLLYLAQKYNLYILEDDYLSELRLYGEGSMPIKSLDARERIIYLKSFSKIFMPGIRLGFLVAPEVISKKILSAKHNTDISTSSLMQRAFDLYLRKRKWHEHMNIMQKVYRERYDVVVEELKRKMPYVSFEEPHGGIHLWGSTDLDSSILSSLGQKKGVLIAPGRVFYIDGRESGFFRISFAGVDKRDISEGIKLLNEAYEDYKNMDTSNIMPFL